MPANTLTADVEESGEAIDNESCRSRSPTECKLAKPQAAKKTSEESSPYGLAFWLTYVANTAIMVAMSLLFRFSDFVQFFGGGEFELGLIVGVGMVGSLLMRLAQGSGIDRYGCRTVWLWSMALFVTALLGHTLLTTVHGPAVYVLHVLFRTAAAGAFGASITFVALSVPVPRMAEAVGTLGTSGFVGMVLGPMLGDWLLGTRAGGAEVLDMMFFTAAALGFVSWLAAYFATRQEPKPTPRRQPPVGALLRRYHPGPMLLMGIAMGVGVGLPNTFVVPFAQELRIERIALFFTVYAISAFTTRVCTRRIVQRWGIRPTILTGMALLIAGMAAFIGVRELWQFLIPAVLTGGAHALLFPAVVAGGSSSFPARYRGLGTALMLATLDVGILVGAPLAGAIVQFARVLELHGYTTMFLCIAALMLVATGYYALATRGRER